MQRATFYTLAGILIAVALFGACSPRDTGEVPRPQPVEEAKQAPAPERKVFVSRLAGRWYDSNVDPLTEELDAYLANVSGSKPAPVQAMILPHAGYRWSGQTAAYGVATVAGQQFSRVVVMGPSHQAYMENVASVPDATHYETPLGEVPLDTEFMAALKQYPCFTTLQMFHENEHSVQIEIPLLQRVLTDFRLVPILVGQIDEATARTMAGILRGLIDAQTLVVVSSDFTHYGPDHRYEPFPHDESTEENLRKLDMGAVDLILKHDMPGFRAYVQETGDTICGRSPISVLLAMLPEDSEGHLLKYETSGNLLQDFRNSVSYACIVFTGTWPETKPSPVSQDEAALSAEDKRRLLQLARGTLEYVMKHQEMPSPEDLDIEITPGMRQIMGAFVTLTEHGQLRGCIGEVIPTRPLYRVVMERVLSAAFSDQRFQPVEASELPELHYEISAYADPPRPVDSYNDIVIGKQGMVLEKDGRSALYLPQVAPEQGWDLDETLTHLSQKAGLAPDAWKEGAQFSVFEAIVFDEDEFAQEDAGAPTTPTLADTT